MKNSTQTSLPLDGHNSIYHAEAINSHNNLSSKSRLTQPSDASNIKIVRSGPTAAATRLAGSHFILCNTKSTLYHADMPSSRCQQTERSIVLNRVLNRALNHIFNRLNRARIHL